MGVIKETGPDTYRRNGFSTSLSAKRYSDAYPCMYVRQSPALPCPLELPSSKLAPISPPILM
jgi:hypothetical protein